MLHFRRMSISILSIVLHNQLIHHVCFNAGIIRLSDYISLFLIFSIDCNATIFCLHLHAYISLARAARVLLYCIKVNNDKHALIHMRVYHWTLDRHL